MLNKMMIAGAVAVMLPLFASAEDVMSIDARFDKTGDQLVDASDWKAMSKAERMAYAYGSLESLGIDPYSKVSGEKTRMQQYLEGLASVYE